MALPWESNFEEILSKNKSVYAGTGVWWSCMLLLIGSIRADIGTENIYLAGIQWFWRNNSRDSFSKGKTFLYGCLAPYQRIEAWWSQFRRVYADWCMQHFQELRESGLYCDSNTIIHIEFDFVTWNLCTYHLLPLGSFPGIPPRTQREPRGGTILLFFFSRGEGDLSFRKDFNGPRRHTRKICSRPARWKVL